MSQKTSLQTPRSFLQKATPRMTNTPIKLDFVAPPLRVIPISELIFTYMDCRAVNFTPPAYKTMKACAGIFRLVLKDLGMSVDMDTRYLGGTHPQYNLTLPKRITKLFIQGCYSKTIDRRDRV